MTPAERSEVLSVLRSERFVDQALPAVYATLLDKDTYLCSISTRYRLLAEQGETGERRRQATHPPTVKPELQAERPNAVWSWDITKLLADTCYRQNISHGQLSIHADRGSSMASKPVALLLADLGVTTSHSRPHVSNDNPFSESHFKTLKYRPAFPDRFDSIEHARTFCHDFFGWYNHQHRHSGIALMARADIHYGCASQIAAARSRVLEAAYQARPERFVRKPPLPPALGAVS